MDFMRVLKSLEEVLYEVISWLVFYPATLVRAMLRPQSMMAYADAELADDLDDRYADTLSPPLFLLLTLLIMHVVEIALLPADGGLVRNTPRPLENHQNLLAFRAVTYSLFPLLMALALLRKRGVPIDRRTLRAPFYSQCFVAAPFAIGLSLAAILSRQEWNGAQQTATIVMIASYLWYLVVETRWFARDLGISVPRAIGMTTFVLLKATLGLLACVTLLAQL